jgi:Na+/melibiose symporter-like transporter
MADLPSKVSRKIVLAFSVGSLGTGMYLTIPSLLLFYYLTDVLAVSPALAGLAVFVPRAWDILVDPVVGWLSDRTRSRLGRRRPYLFVGALLTALTFIFLFSAPELPTQTSRFAYVLSVYFVSATAYSIFAVPYLSMPAEMSPDEGERAAIMTYRMTFAMAGVLIGAAAAPALVQAFGGGRTGYSAMSLVMGVTCGLMMFIAFLGTARAPVIRASQEEAQSGRMLDALRDRLFRPLALAYLLQLAGLGVFTGIAPYFVRYVLGHTDSDLSSLFLALLAGTLLSLFGWLWLSARIGKAAAYLLAAGLSTFAFAAMWQTDQPDDWITAMLLTALAGIGFGGLQLLPFAMLTDVIHAARESRRDCAGAFTGLWTAVEKSGLALGPLVIAGFLQLGGFRSGSPVQTPGAIESIRYTVSIAPALLILCSIPALFAYARRSRDGAGFDTAAPPVPAAASEST